MIYRILSKLIVNSKIYLQLKLVIYCVNYHLTKNTKVEQMDRIVLVKQRYYVQLHSPANLNA